jgi:hypothetical protein
VADFFALVVISTATETALTAGRLVTVRERRAMLVWPAVNFNPAKRRRHTRFARLLQLAREHAVAVRQSTQDRRAIAAPRV